MGIVKSFIIKLVKIIEVGKMSKIEKKSDKKILNSIDVIFFISFNFPNAP